MFCPQCGQQQAPDVVRYCSRCGFLLDGVVHLLHNRGMLPAFASVQASNEISPRRRGVKQGGILLLTGGLLVPVLGVISSFSEAVLLDVIVAVAAIICFLGGPLRMLYAALFEEGAPSPQFPVPPYIPASNQISPPIPARGIGALPPPVANPATGWRTRPTTAELAQPPSITENTTRLLDKDDPRER
jgi:hypothetical protein